MNDTLDIHDGYVIRERYIVGKTGFVLGERDTEEAGYATWQYKTDEPTSYRAGNYFSSKASAYQDYQMRIAREAIELRQHTGQRPLLPPLCLKVLQWDGSLIMIRRGEMGYTPSPFDTGNPKDNEELAEIINEQVGVTKAQEEAMYCGSMFGWDTKLSDPRNYDEHGKLKATPSKAAAKKKNQPER